MVGAACAPWRLAGSAVRGAAGAIEDLDRALQCLETGKGKEAWPLLGHWLAARYEQKGDIDDLDRAIKLTQSALDRDPVPLPGQMRDLAHQIGLRYAHRGKRRISTKPPTWPGLPAATRSEEQADQRTESASLLSRSPASANISVPKTGRLALSYSPAEASRHRRPPPATSHAARPARQLSRSTFQWTCRPGRSCSSN